MSDWTFLSSHGRILLCIARDPGMRLRDIADAVAITERRAFGIVTDLTEAGYVVKTRQGRRNTYQIQTHLPLPEATSPHRTIGEVLALLADTPSAPATDAGPGRTGPGVTDGPRRAR